MANTDFLGLRTVIYRVANLEQARAWYSGLLGFAPYFDEPFYVGFNVGGYELGLLPQEGRSGATTYWGVDDIEAAFQKLISSGATAIEQPTDVGGDIKVASVQDLWGNEVGIIYNPHFSPVSN